MVQESSNFSESTKMKATQPIRYMLNIKALARAVTILIIILRCIESCDKPLDTLHLLMAMLNDD